MLHKMNSNKSCVCLCCGCRLIQNGPRRVTDKYLCLFIATRVFPSYLPNDGHACTKCRSIHNKWKVLPKFHDIVTMINDGHEATNTTNDNVRSEATSRDVTGTDNLPVRSRSTIPYRPVETDFLDGLV